MKYIKILSILLLCSVVSFYSCDDKSNARKQEARESLKVYDSPTTPNAATPTPPTAEPAQNSAGVWHYTCNKGCAGGAGAAGTCATCGGPLAHNKAYHDNANNATTPPTTPQINPTLTPPPPTTEPAQNAAGVWHYTCGKGCAGGAGAAGTCAGCGGALTHNTAYHQ